MQANPQKHSTRDGVTRQSRHPIKDQLLDHAREPRGQAGAHKTENADAADTSTRLISSGGKTGHGPSSRCG